MTTVTISDDWEVANVGNYWEWPKLESSGGRGAGLWVVGNWALMGHKLGQLWANLG